MRPVRVVLGIALLASVMGGCVSVSRTEVAASPATTTTVVAPPGTTAVAVTAEPWCNGVFSEGRGTNFGDCLIRPLK